MVFLPLFPLNMVVFPGEKLNLHIFEPRYKQLIGEVEKDGSPFGIPSFLNNKLMSFGTLMELTKIDKRYPNGELDIKTKGKLVFEIKDYQPIVEGKLYGAAQVELYDLDKKGDPEISGAIIPLIRSLYEMLKINKPIPENADAFCTFDVAHHVGFNLEQEYTLVTMQAELERQEFMLNHLQNLIPVVREMEALRKKAEMNGHFKNLPPLIN